MNLCTSRARRTATSTHEIGLGVSGLRVLGVGLQRILDVRLYIHVYIIVSQIDR